MRLPDGRRLSTAPYVRFPRAKRKKLNFFNVKGTHGTQEKFSICIDKNEFENFPGPREYPKHKKILKISLGLREYPNHKKF